jgi:hypothetical protein
MKTDTTTKLLLAALAGALWVIALRPALTPVPAVAQGQQPNQWATPALSLGNDGIYVAAPSGQSGQVFRFAGKLGEPQQIGSYGPRQATGR